jgi:hypothetical protein
MAAPIPDEISKLQKLEKLDLRWMNIGGELPWEHICRLTSLETLDFSYNDQLELCAVPDDISQLVGLRELSLAETNLGGEYSLLIEEPRQ